MPTKEDSPSPTLSLYSEFGMKGEAALPRGGYSLVGSPVHLFGQLPVHLILFSAADATVALASRVCLPKDRNGCGRTRTVDGADSSQIGISTSRRLPHDVEPRLHRSWCGSGPFALSCLKTLRTKTLWSGRWFIGLFCICPSDDG